MHPFQIANIKRSWYHYSEMVQLNRKVPIELFISNPNLVEEDLTL